jgi:two-component system CheB/CheR fusion protein
VLDIGLPDANGYEVARQLRADKTMQDLYIIALTGYGNDGDVVQAREAGFDAHLLKPTRMNDVLELIAARPKNHFH